MLSGQPDLEDDATTMEQGNWGRSTSKPCCCRTGVWFHGAHMPGDRGSIVCVCCFDGPRSGSDVLPANPKVHACTIGSSCSKIEFLLLSLLVNIVQR